MQPDVAVSESFAAAVDGSIQFAEGVGRDNARPNAAPICPPCCL